MTKKEKRKLRNTEINILCAVAMLLTGCQKSPETSVVVNKDLDKLIEQAENPDKKEMGESALEMKPNHYKTTIEDDKMNVKVTVDADVKIPKADKMSVFRVKQQKVSQELLDAVRKELLGDTVLYEGSVLHEPTKKEIEESIKSARTEQKLFEEDSEGWNQAQERIDKWEEDYKRAPGEVSLENRELDGTFEVISEKCKEEYPEEFYVGLSSMVENGNVFYGVGDSEDDNYVGLYAMNSDNRGNFLSYNKNTYTYPFSVIDGFSYYDLEQFDEMLDANGNKDLPRISVDETKNLSLEEAIQIADAFLEKIGINNQTTKFQYCEGGLTVDPTVLENEIRMHTQYVLTYSRYMNGAFLTVTDELKWNEGTMQGVYHKNIWPTEKIEFRINNNGIVGFDYKAPLSVKETVVDNASLKSLEQIKKIFEKMIVVTNASQFNEEVHIDINRVVLGYALISEPDCFDSGLLVPAWDFYGTKKYQENGTVVDAGEGCYLTINAIDGSIIDR